ncbi:hypothetical protein RBB50_007009 [Rhinocladiella similis]
MELKTVVSEGRLSMEAVTGVSGPHPPMQCSTDTLQAVESGIDQSGTNKFPACTVGYGRKVSGAGSNSEIPPEDGGIVKEAGRPTKSGGFGQGEAGKGPEDVAARRSQDQGGDDDVRSIIKNA